MPDLGSYAGAVLGAYAASIALIVALVVLSLWQAVRIRRTLADIETRGEGRR